MAIGWGSSQMSGGMSSKNNKRAKKMTKMILVAACAAVLLVSGCATVEGFGRDISGGANRVSGWIN